MDPTVRTIVVTVLFGLVAGWLASFVVGGGSVLRYVVTGLVGAVVGGYLMRALGINLGIRNELVAEIVTATIGAIVVVLLARMIA